MRIILVISLVSYYNPNLAQKLNIDFNEQA